MPHSGSGRGSCLQAPVVMHCLSMLFQFQHMCLSVHHCARLAQAARVPCCDVKQGPEGSAWIEETKVNALWLQRYNMVTPEWAKRKFAPAEGEGQPGDSVPSAPPLPFPGDGDIPTAAGRQLRRGNVARRLDEASPRRGHPAVPQSMLDASARV